MNIVTHFKIHEISMKNWGPFNPNEEVKIQFSVDNVKNVTYILGKNGSGKSHCFQALKWVLFPDEKIKHLDVPSVKKILSIPAKESTSSNKIELEVRVKFEYGSNSEDLDIYHVLRRLSFIKIEDNVKYEEYFICQKDHHDPEIGLYDLDKNEYLKEINKIFPKAPRIYFFLDGERMSENFKSSNMSSVKEFAYSLSPIPILTFLNDKFIDLYKPLQSYRMTRAVNQQVKDKGKLITLQNDINDLEESITINFKEQQKLIKENEDLEAEVQELGEFLEGGLTTLPEKINELKETEKSITSTHKEILIKNGELSDKLAETLPFVLLRDKMGLCLKDLEEKRESGILPKVIDTSILEISLYEDKCRICNRELDEDSRAYVNNLRKKSTNIEESQKVTEFQKTLDFYKDNLENKIEAIWEIHKEKGLLLSKKRSLESNLESVQNEVSSFTEDPILWKSKNEEMSKKSVKRGRNIEKVKAIEGSLKKMNDDLLKKREARDGLMDTKENPKLKVLKSVEVWIDKVLRNLQKMEEIITDQINFYIEKLTFERWKQLIEDPSIWKEIKITCNATSKVWRISPHKKGMSEAPTPSQGQRHILGISFLTALASIFEANYPLIFDSPFGRVDIQPIKNIGHNLPKILNGSQIILFVTDTENRAMQESDKDLRSAIDDHIGRKWVLIKSETEPPISHPKEIVGDFNG